MKIFNLTAHIFASGNSSFNGIPNAVCNDKILARGQNMAVAKFSRMLSYEYPNCKIDIVKVNTLNSK